MVTRTRPSLERKTAKKKLAGYLRLTNDRNGNKIGYEVQRKAILAWCSAHGYSIGQWYQDKDITAADLKVVRPSYEEMLKDLAAGSWGGIVVWKLDRLVRLGREFHRCYGIVKDAGGFIACIDPGFDTRHGFGATFMSLLVDIAEMEILTMKARQKGHQQEKAENGRHHGGGARAFGFVGTVIDPDTNEPLNYNKREIGVKFVPSEVALLQEAARRIAWERDTYASVLRDWASRNPPVLGTNGKPMSVGTLTDLLTRPRIIGKRTVEFVDEETGEIEEIQYDADWDAIIDRPTWERLRSLRTVRAEEGRPNEYLLTGGLLRCGKCDYSLVGGRRKHWKTNEYIPAYRCPSTSEAAARGACGGMNVVSDPVEKIVVAWVIARLEKNPDLHMPEEKSTQADAIAAALKEISSCENQLVLNARLRASGKLMKIEEDAERPILMDRLNSAKESLAQAKAQETTPAPHGSERENLMAWFQAMTQPQKRAFLEVHLKSVRILSAARGRHTFDPSRIIIIPADTKKLN